MSIPSKKVLDKIPAQDLDQLAKIMPAKFWPRSYSRYGKISASWQDLALLGRNLSQELFAGSWRSCPVLVGGWELTVEGWGTVSPKMVVVQVATVVAIVMVLWYQSSPIQYYWYYALPLVCCSYVWVRRSAFVPPGKGWQPIACCF